MHGLSRLSVWWLRLGIQIERIKPGNPQQNGRHERMHRALKQATTKPAGSNMLQQQVKFERFVQEYNFERPHEALAMITPGALYQASPRVYKGCQSCNTPSTTEASPSRSICMERKKVNLEPTEQPGELRHHRGPPAQ